MDSIFTKGEADGLRRRWLAALATATLLNVALIAAVGLCHSPESVQSGERILHIVMMPPDVPHVQKDKPVVRERQLRTPGPRSVARRTIARARRATSSEARRLVVAPVRRVVERVVHPPIVKVPVQIAATPTVQVAVPSEALAPVVPVPIPSVPVPITPAAPAVVPVPSPTRGPTETVVASAPAAASGNAVGGGETGTASGNGQGGNSVGTGHGSGNGNGNGSSGGPFGVGDGGGGGAPRHVVYVLDVSPSMVSRIDRARAELHSALMSLGGGESFDLMVFGDYPVKFASGLVDASPDNVRSADHFLETADFIPGTNLEAAMRAALAVPGINEVIVITDGVPTDGEMDFGKLAQLVQEHNTEHAVIDTIGLVGKNPDGTDDTFEATKLLQDIARDSGGASRIVQVGVNESD